MIVELPGDLLDIARAIREAGGRALVVGGYVRDQLRGQTSKDIDVEVYGLALDALELLLARFGSVLTIGRSFGVLRLKELNVDFSLPRRDSKSDIGHRGFVVTTDPGLDFATAARRRDLTINSLGLDPLTRELLDPHGGQQDLERGILRATDAAHFGEDPLRGLRVAQFAARFDMQADEQLCALCAGLDLSELSPERIYGEFSKLLLEAARPSIGLAFLHRTNLLRFFPELAALIGVDQDPEWHPEGDVWVHTLMVVDEAAALRDHTADDAALMFGALCHDLGKPATTVVKRGHIRSPGHDVEGVAFAQQFLGRLRAPNQLVTRVCALVEHHLAPALFIKNGAGAKGYRRLARKLDAAGVDVNLLLKVAHADHLGRTTSEALARKFPAGDEFLQNAKALSIDREAPKDAVLGRHLLARGLDPGPHFAVLLERCRALQDEHGLTDPETILDLAGIFPQDPQKR